MAFDGQQSLEIHRLKFGQICSMPNSRSKMMFSFAQRVSLGISVSVDMISKN